MGQSWEQEYYKGHAQDQFKVIGVFGTNAVLTQETTPLEPGTVDHKLYVRGIGTVFEQTAKARTSATSSYPSHAASPVPRQRDR